MATKNIVPRTGSEGEIGTSSKPWSKAHIDELTATQVSSSYLSASSDARVAGNSHFGSELTNTHIFTGSFHQTGSGATSFFKDTIDVTGNLTASGHVSASVFYGDGSGLTGVTGEWDGSHNGNASITGSLTMTGSSPDMPQLNIINSSGSHIQPDFSTGMSAIFQGFAQEFVPGSGIGIMGSAVESSGSSGEQAFLSTLVDANGTAGQMAEAKIYVTGTSGGGLTTGATQIKVTTDGNIDARSPLANYYRFTTTDEATGVYVGLGSSATTGSVTVGYPGAAGETRMTFKTSNNATGETDRMTLDHDGNFGIGTATPTKTLDVVGNVSASQEISASSFWGDGSNLSGITFTETDTLATVTARGATTTTPVNFNTHITASSGINSGPLHVAGSSVHSGTIDLYSGGGLHFYGENGVESGSIKHFGGGLTIGNTATTALGLFTFGPEVFMSNAAASVSVNGANITTTPSAGGVAQIVGDSEVSGTLVVSASSGVTSLNPNSANWITGSSITLAAPAINLKNGDVTVGVASESRQVAVNGTLSASLGITASSFIGDGSGLTGITTSTPTLDQVTTAGSTTTNNISVADLTVTEITASGIISSSVQAYIPKINLNNSFSSNYIGYSNGGFFYKGDGAFYGNLTSSVFSASSGFIGDGSGLTNLPAASWDGQLNGDAGITGSLDVSGSSEFGNLSTDTHQFTGSIHLSGAFYAGTESPEEHHQMIGTLLVDAAGTNNSEIIIDGPNPNWIMLKRNGTQVGKIATDGYNFTIYGGNSSGNTGIAAVHLYDNTQSKALTHFKPSSGINFPGTDSQVNISSSSKAFRIDTDTGNNVFTVEDDTTGLTHLSASGQIYGNGYDNGQKTANFTIDWNNGSNQIVSVSGAAATGLTASFSNIKPWSTYQFIYQVDKTSMELYLDHSIFWPGGTRPSLSNVSGSRDIITFTTDGNSNMYAVAQFNFSASVG